MTDAEKAELKRQAERAIDKGGEGWSLDVLAVDLLALLEENERLTTRLRDATNTATATIEAAQKEKREAVEKGDSEGEFFSDGEQAGATKVLTALMGL